MGGSAGEQPGKTAGSSGRTGAGTSGRDQPGRGGQIGLGGASSAGDGGSGSPGGGGGRQVSPDGGMGGDPYCGGCSPNWYEVKCSWGDVPLGGEAAYGYDEEGFQGPSAACAGALRNSENPSGGQGGASEVSPGSCETYVAPGRVEFDDSGCIAVEAESLAAECHVGGECCVVVERIACGV